MQSPWINGLTILLLETGLEIQGAVLYRNMIAID